MHPPLEDLLPHKAPMILISRLGTLGENGLSAYVDISQHSAFYEDRGVPAYVGLEFMAQTVAAYAGYLAHLKQKKVKEGFLLGTREVEFARSFFRAGETLVVHCEELIHNDGMGVFTCHIEDSNANVVCACKLNVFQPEHPELFFRTHA